ncbi:MAG: dihydrolipoamide acetyltransferase family protein [Planctomycetota bacterium]|jgi:pyruvate dehydrogenase E2 component (dihydrolipoamide acetyltransferase)
MEIKQPKDKSHFLLPDLGEGVQEAELIKWRVKPGERVEELDVIAEMETDKAMVEVPTPWGGVIKELHGKEGEILNVGTKLVSYEAGTSAGADHSHDDTELPPPAEEEDAGTVVGSVDSSLAVSDRFLRTDSGGGSTAVVTPSKALATPAVRRVARELGVDIHTVPGTGRGGRVTATDVRAAAGGAPAPAAVPAPALAPAPVHIGTDGVSQRIPFRGVRRKIAEALGHSVRTAVHFTVVDEADVTELESKRREYAAVMGRKLSILPFVMTAVCRALREHPELNANVDDERGEILIQGVINLGCAVDTDHGLMVPVIPNAGTMNVTQLAEAVDDLAGAARDRTIERERLMGGTFTISNVGSYGGMFATPIINYPEVGILGVGRAKERVLTKNGAFYAGRVLPLSMSCDHRVVDGALGARFLGTVVQLLENPAALIGV